MEKVSINGRNDGGGGGGSISLQLKIGLCGVGGGERLIPNFS